MAAEGTAEACPGEGASVGPGIPGACRVLCPGLQNEPGKEPGSGSWPVLGPPSAQVLDCEGDGAPAPCLRPTLQERMPLLLRITLWDHPENELQASFSPDLLFWVCHGPQGGPARPQTMPSCWPQDTDPSPCLGPLPGPAHPQSVSRQGQEPGTLHRAPHQPLRAAPSNPGDSRCLPPPTSPLTVSMPQRWEGH